VTNTHASPKIDTWYRQLLQDFKQSTSLRTSMPLSSAIHLVLHIQSLKKHSK
jgi:hypothetical protein